MTINQYKINNSIVYVGEFPDDLSLLWGMLHHKQFEILQEHLKDTQNQQVIREKIGTYLLLSHICEHHFTLSHLPSGKPVLHNNQAISISHSGNFVSIIQHPTHSVGIDLELRTRNASKAISRVCTSRELECIYSHPSPNDMALLFWCAKEAAYKMLSEYDLNFSEDIEVVLTQTIDFNLNNCSSDEFGHYKEGTINVLVKNIMYSLCFKITNQFILCWGATLSA